MYDPWFALLLEFLENSWNFFQGPGKVLVNLFLTSTPGNSLKFLLIVGVILRKYLFESFLSKKNAVCK
jgi:hypothetical protein